MKTKTHISKLGIFCLMLMIALSSCTVQRRHYTDGWYVAKNGSHQQSTLQKSEKIFQKYSVDISPRTTRSVYQADTADIRLTALAFAAPAIPSPKHSMLYRAPVNKKIQYAKPLLKMLPTLFSMAEPKNHSLAVWALVMGILALVTYYGALLFAILAIVLGMKALKKIDADPQTYKGRGMAKTGMILGIIGCVLLAVLILAL